MAWHGEPNRQAGTWQLPTATWISSRPRRRPGRDGGCSDGSGHRAAVHLPTLGRLVLGPPVRRAGPRAAETGTVSVIRNAVIIRVGGACWTIGLDALLAGRPAPARFPGDGAAEWQPVRMLRAAGFRVALEDTDPFRDCDQWPAASRLTAAEAAAWQRDFGAAWQEIVREQTVRPGARRRAHHADPAGGRPRTARVRQGQKRVRGGRRRSAGGCGRPGRAAPPGVRTETGCGSRPVRSLRPSRRRLFPCRGERARADRGAPAGRLRAAGGRGVLAREPAAHGRSRGRGGWAPIPRMYAQVGEAIGTLLGSGALTTLGTRFLEEMRNCLRTDAVGNEPG